ncbi:uncharacterized protein LOC135689417 [Rhopilema esculentum]|uniref:uncharacterized protein LOC135689417 n=1 Tax=Rhopilema esculentum TaxID=499914 RepID=UPI0031DD5112
MVPRIHENREDCCRSLLHDDSAKNQFRPKPSFLIRILKSLGFIKTILKSVSSESALGDASDCDEDKRSDRLISDSVSYKEPERAKESNNFESSRESLRDYGTFLEITDLDPQDNLALQIKEIVTNSPECTCPLISDWVALKVAKDIIESAEDEPCGLQGCRVILHLEDKVGRINLGEFSPKDGFICTFEVHVVLRIRSGGIRYFIPFVGCMPQRKLVSDSYCINKQKLYTCSSNSRGPTPVHF